MPNNPTMKAFVLTGHGDMDKLVWHDDWPMPQANADEVLIKVFACGLNNTDVNTRSGWYSKAVTDATTGGAYEVVHEEDPTWGGGAIQFPRIQGADIVGEVVEVGTNGDPSLVGKRVMAGCGTGIIPMIWILPGILDPKPTADLLNMPRSTIAMSCRLIPI